MSDSFLFNFYLDRNGLDAKAIHCLSQLDKAYFPTPWSENSWNEILFTDQLLVILKKGEEFIGFALFNLAESERFAHLVKFLIVPKDRGAGLGKALLIESLNKLKTSNYGRFFLEVESTNKPAIEVYLSVGFCALHNKKHFYGTGRDAIIMELDLEKS